MYHGFQWAYRTGSRVPQAKLTAEKVRYIRANPHLTLKVLALKFNVNQSTICMARMGVTWTGKK